MSKKKLPDLELRRANPSEASSWGCMIARCYRLRTNGFERYGGRGITVCDSWLTSFAAFLNDMGPKPHPGYTIDRKDPEGNYEPSNCQWATRAEQNRDRRKAKTLNLSTEERTRRSQLVLGMQAQGKMRGKQPGQPRAKRKTAVTEEERQHHRDAALHRWAARSPEQRKQIHDKQLTSTTHEQRSASAYKMWETRRRNEAA